MAIGNRAAFNAEYTPTTVRAVGQAVVDAFVPITWAHIGFKGDDRHDGGYHRSLRWCTLTRGAGVDYSDRLARDVSQRATVRRDAIRAIDISAPDHILLPMCQRVDKAMRAGLLDDVREWYGNRDGDSRVDGYDNFYNAVVSSDSSHLWHLHLSLYTDTVDQPHTRLIAVLLGTPGWDRPAKETDVIESSKHGQALMYRVAALVNGADTVQGGPTKGEPVWLNRALKSVANAIGQVDEAVAAQLRAEFTELDAAVAAARAEIGQVDEEVVDQLAGAGTAAEQAEVLRRALGDRALEVGRLLSGDKG
jgi:hypothetical protein